MTKYKEKLISNTGTGVKLIINMQVAEKYLDDNAMQRLNNIIDELNYIQQNMINKK